MRLTKIKLAGFKSFVDPTTFHLPSNLIGIVGPNGCGKSNIIDAVRWVMGESSARSLRGESMADVIFNGSATRKPVGQASIELVFDNSAGKLGGPWVHYNEISIKRLLTRDGQSSYFLNNTRCRRRDITDIFLGTGLGPRSYAIIEQGMISRVIESRPEELRVFLEEAAGISKYKERRRETEARIRHTRNNLDRMNDLRAELAKQLQHLQRQSRVAEQYQRYKAEERCIKAELLALRWQALDAEFADWGRRIREQETALEAVVAEQRATEARLEAGRLCQGTLNERLCGVQSQYFEIGMEITRLEQGLKHQAELRRRQVEELHQSEQTLETLQENIRLDEGQIRELEGMLTQDQPTLEAVRAVEAAAVERLEGAEAAMQDWQAVWEGFSRREADYQRLAAIERTGIEHLQRQLAQHERRMTRLCSEREGLKDKELQEDLQALQQRERETEVALSRDQAALAQIDGEIAELRASHRQVSAILHTTRERVQAGQGRLASLETLQEAALEGYKETVGPWLNERQLDRAPRLAEQVDVDPGWEQAVETVLGCHLQALCVADLEAPALALAQLEQGSLTLFDIAALRRGQETAPHDALATKVRAPWPLDSLFCGVRMAADSRDALARRGALMDHESLITPDGIWLGRDWLRVMRGNDTNSGVLARERQIKAVRAALDQDNEALDRHARILERIRTDLSDRERRRSATQTAVNKGHRDHGRLQAQVKAQQLQLQQALARHRAIDGELEELRQYGQHDQAALQETRQRLEEALQAMAQLAGERQTLLKRGDAVRGALEEQRTEVATARQEFQRQAVAVESRRTALASTRQALQRLRAQYTQLQARRQRLAAEIATGDEPLKATQMRLEERLAQRRETEEKLNDARRAVAEQDSAVRCLEQARAALERQVQGLRQALEAQRLNWGEVKVRRQTLMDQLQGLEADPVMVLAALPAGAEEGQWQGRLEQLERRIQRLGAVNLAAIEEFAQLSERSHYLDVQHDDLVEALTTLESAMGKIDQQTRAYLKDIFNRVNQGLQGLFPRLFGGGEAYLELTGGDLLNAGIAIMAKPPGKRIGNVHLLSGGEKALAAVALVFAIFQLNPAPFCMLDEVDAPLDEANVGRFGKLVQEMAEQVQFIFITHNKGTMEIARYLLGVTMHEPGVSRLVGVDVDEAVRLAAV